MTEYLRPWTSAACGIGLPIAGAYYYEFPDWDVAISIIMALLTYHRTLVSACRARTPVEELAGHAVRALVNGRRELLAHWSLVNPAALELRSATFLMSLSSMDLRRAVALPRVFQMLPKRSAFCADLVPTTSVDWQRMPAIYCAGGTVRAVSVV
jgi:hypothetical protein